MHDTGLAAGAAFFSAYLGGGIRRILDLGAMDVNGSLRSVAPQACEYVGVDLEPGPGVDVVAKLGEPFDTEMGQFDACVSVSTFEHDSHFWITFGCVLDVIRPGGFVFICAPSNGPYHAFPRDSWRFYPDAGLALADWANNQGRAVTLLESGVLRRRNDIWNDLVMVFQKSPAQPRAPGSFLLDAFPDAMNQRRLGVEKMINPEVTPEDVLLRYASEQEARQAEAELGHARERLIEVELRLKQEEERALAAMREAAERLIQVELRLKHEEVRASAAMREAAELEQRINELRASNSWRVTAPLRAIARMLK